MSQQLNRRFHRGIGFEGDRIPFGEGFHIWDDSRLFEISFRSGGVKRFRGDPHLLVVVEIITVQHFHVAEAGLPDNFGATEVFQHPGKDLAIADRILAHDDDNRHGL